MRAEAMTEKQLTDCVMPLWCKGSHLVYSSGDQGDLTRRSEPFVSVPVANSYQALAEDDV